MASYSIIILDANEKRSDFFESLFMRDDYKVSVFDSLKSLPQTNAQNDINAVLVEYGTLVDEERADVVAFFSRYRGHNLFVYNVPDNANKRLAFYELGARRVFDASQPGEEIYYALAWPLKNLRGDLDKATLFSAGNLEDVSLKTLLNNLAREERTGILKMVTSENSGKIYFKEGQATHAQVGVHRGERALLHMLFWHQGTFQFISTAGVDGAYSVHISNVALLIEAEKLRIAYIDDLENIGPMHSVVRLQYAGDLAHSSIEVDTAFIRLIEHPVRLNRILENPVYTSFETASLLRKLKAGGFLSVRQPAQPVLKEYESQLVASNIKSPLFNAEESSQIIGQLGIGGQDNAKIAVISSAGKGSLGFICKMAGVNVPSHDLSRVSLAHIKLNDETSLMCFSLSMDKNILMSIEKLVEGLAGFVFLIDAGMEDRFEYINYAINQILTIYSLPWIAGVFNLRADQDMEWISEKLSLRREVPFIQCEPGEAEDVKHAMLMLRVYEKPREEEEETGQEEQEEGEQ